MDVINVLPRTILVQLELTLDEVDAISLALSKSYVNVANEEDKHAQDVLAKFSNMLNSILDKCNVPELQGK